MGLNFDVFPGFQQIPCYAYTVYFTQYPYIPPLLQLQSRREESAQKELKLNLEVGYYAEHIPTMDLQFCPVAPPQQEAKQSGPDL